MEIESGTITKCALKAAQSLSTPGLAARPPSLGPSLNQGVTAAVDRMSEGPKDEGGGELCHLFVCVCVSRWKRSGRIDAELWIMLISGS